MDRSLSLHLDHLDPVYFSAEAKLPSLEEVTGLKDIFDLVTEASGGIPGVISERIDKMWFERGFRLCDSSVGHPTKKCKINLHSLVVPQGLDKSLNRLRRKNILARGVSRKESNLKTEEFFSICKNVLDTIERVASKGSFSLEHYRQGDPSVPSGSLSSIILTGRGAKKGTFSYKRWMNFIKFISFKGHKFGRAEQAVHALHIDMLLFTDLRFGLGSYPEVYAGILLAALMDPLRLTKQYKAWTTNKEKELFGYMGQLPPISEKVLPFEEHLLDHLMTKSAFQLVTARPRTREEIDTTQKWLQYFIPSRNLPCPDDRGTADVYTTYISFLCTTEHPGTIVSSEQAEEWRSGPVGNRVEKFLSESLASDILGRVANHPTGESSRLLCGDSTASNSLSTSSNWKFSRARMGHYGEAVNEILPFLEVPIQEHFPYLVTEEDEVFICTDYGDALCPRDLGSAPTWQVAMLMMNPFSPEDKLFDVINEEAKTNEGRAGMDCRFGVFILLYAMVNVRPWIEILDRLDENGLARNATENEIREFAEREGIQFPRERTIPVLEPGGKVRWVSCTEGALIYYQLGFSDMLRTLYSNIIGARIGLTSDHHLFRFEQSFANHTFNKLLQFEGDPTSISPQEVRDQVQMYKDQKIPEEERDRILRTWLFVKVAVRLTSVYRISLLPALVSLVPLGLELRKSLLLQIQSDELFTNEWKGLINCSNFDEVEDYVLDSTELRAQLITTTTTDMVKATDTIRHDSGYRNLTEMLSLLGFDVRPPDRSGSP